MVCRRPSTPRRERLRERPAAPERRPLRRQRLFRLFDDCGALVAGDLHFALACAGGPAEAEDVGGAFFGAEAGEDFGGGLAEVAWRRRGLRGTACARRRGFRRSCRCRYDCRCRRRGRARANCFRCRRHFSGAWEAGAFCVISRSGEAVAFGIEGDHAARIVQDDFIEPGSRA